LLQVFTGKPTIIENLLGNYRKLAREREDSDRKIYFSVNRPPDRKTEPNDSSNHVTSASRKGKSQIKQKIPNSRRSKRIGKAKLKFETTLDVGV
jgi:hypothetical protein